jgi:hypothetical protein
MVPRRFCTECGHELRPGARFCSTCGHTATLSGEPTAQAGVDSGTRDSGATTTASVRRGTSPRPWPPSEPVYPPPDEIGAVLPDQELAGHRPLPPSDYQAPGQRRYRFGPLLITGLVVVVVAGIAAAIVILHPFGQHSPSPPPSPSPTFRSSSPSPTSTSRSLSPQHQAAGSLAALVSQSAGDRNSVNGAYNDVLRCGPNLGQDVQTFRNSAASRQGLLSQLADMPSRSALPAQMLQELTSAWQISVEADKDFAAWAQDQVSNGCISNQSDPNLRAARGPDVQATADKKAFLRLWNPLAVEYSLSTYQPGDL